MSTTTCVGIMEEHSDHPTGIMRWLDATTNHKDITGARCTWDLFFDYVLGRGPE